MGIGDGIAYNLGQQDLLPWDYERHGRIIPNQPGVAGALPAN